MDTKLVKAVNSQRLNLLCSHGGIELLPEICLRVTELLIDSDSKAVGRLQLASKSFFALIKFHEKSVTKTVSKNYHNFEIVNGSEKFVFSFHHGLDIEELERYTYPWVSEMKFRKTIVEFLVKHEITEMAGTIDGDSSKIAGWPSLNVCKKELQFKLNWFKSRALFLLFRLSDSVTGLYTTDTIRDQQSKFLHSLSTKELAFIGVMVEVMGHNFFIITKRTMLKYNPAQSNSHESSRSNSVSENQAGAISDLNDNWIRETMCVFEDLVQRYGPYFAWAYLEGSRDRLSKSSQWARCKIREGIANMNAFELGYTMSYASLQSVVWRAFRQKQGCGSASTWNFAKGLVEKEMKVCPNDVY
ncbi:hypothetical protein HI914_02057 [Erysiphe necator]|nr:hypothetical protein HI914_02057 [Erysiphe necator]